MEAYKFIEGEPEEGTLVLGVTYHVAWQGPISRLLAFAQRHKELFELEHDMLVPGAVKPIGYVMVEE